jgi:hypothetical protein
VGRGGARACDAKPTSRGASNCSFNDRAVARAILLIVAMCIDVASARVQRATI